MKINWKIRFKNKTWLVTFCGVILAFIYQLLGMLGIVPSVSQETIINLIGIVINLLATLGILVDPTTEGINDSERAMSYTELGGKKIDE